MTGAEKIRDFTLHDALGNSMLDKDWLKWINEHAGRGFGPTVSHSWYVGNQRMEVLANRQEEIWEVLPDASGFTCFESDRKPDNCLLLDIFGKERMRLTVPWQLARPQNCNAADFIRQCECPIHQSRGDTGTIPMVVSTGAPNTTIQRTKVRPRAGRPN